MRCLTHGLNYECQEEGKCVIQPENRSKCQGCRQRKCEELGMDATGESQFVLSSIHMYYPALYTDIVSCHFFLLYTDSIFCIPGQSRGYFGFSPVTPPPPPQRFLWNAITQKIFYLGLSNLVWGYRWGMALSLSFGGLGLQEIGL